MCLDIQCFWEIYSLLLLAIYIKIIDYYTPVLGVWERLESFWYRKCRNNDGPQWADPSQFLHSRTLNRVQCWSIQFHHPNTNMSSFLPFWQLDICFCQQYCVKIYVLNFNRSIVGKMWHASGLGTGSFFGFLSRSVSLTLCFQLKPFWHLDLWFHMSVNVICVHVQTQTSLIIHVSVPYLSTYSIYSPLLD